MNTGISEIEVEFMTVFLRTRKNLITHFDLNQYETIFE